VSNGLSFFGDVPLPTGWAQVSLSALRRGQSIIFNPDDKKTQTLELYSVPSHKAKSPEIVKGAEIGSNKQYVEPGDVLLSKINPRLNRAWIVGNFSSHKKIASVEWIVFSNSKFINPKLLQYFLTDMRVCEYLARNASGVGGSLMRVKPALVDTILIALPPLNEQDRIVTKIEALFSELDKGMESLSTAKEQLKAYRQAVLKHAFEGKLTEKWRAENKGRLETADEILDHIKKEREIRYQQQLEEWRVATKTGQGVSRTCKKPRKPRIPKVPTPLTTDVLNRLPELPDCWVYDNLGWMTCGVEYGTAAKSSSSGIVPVIRMGNLQNGQINWNDLVFSSDKDEIEKYRLEAGDVLFNRTNSPELVGKTAIYRGERQALFAGYLIRINHHQSVVDGEYLNLFLNSHVAHQYGNSVKTDGVNQSNINGEKLKNYPFPYCSVMEQREIVRICEEKISMTDHLVSDIDRELKRSSALRQTILKKAFSGQLVKQDPNDKPALVLLEHIKAEKTANNDSYKDQGRRNIK